MRARLLERCLVAVAALLAVCIVHDVPYLLHASYWVDESWVAVSRRFPLAELPSLTSSTPMGWAFLTRLFPDGGQNARLLALLFAAAAVAAAWSLGRGLGWRNRAAALGAGFLAALAALLCPAMLIRDDLKQYTADACLALVLLALVSRLERRWSRRGLAALVVVAVGGMLLSHATVFVAAAGFASVWGVQAARRRTRRLGEASVAAAVAATGMGIVYAAVDAPALLSSLTDYWRDYWLPLEPAAALRFLDDRVRDVQALAGTGPVWCTGLLVLAGLVTIWTGRRPATALTVVLLAPEMVAASAARKYPLLDPRTSTFLLAVVAVTAAVGAAGLAVVLARAVGRAAVVVPVALAAAAVAGAAPYVRSHPIPVEHVAQQVATLTQELAPGDVVLLNSSADWGFGYYWRRGALARVPAPSTTVGFTIAFPGQPDIVLATDRTPAAIGAALRAAQARAHATPGARIFLLRTHLVPAEVSAWAAALTRAHLMPRPVAPDGLLQLLPEFAPNR